MIGSNRRRRLVKVCGITSQEDASLCLAADYLGFIFHPLSPRAVTPALAASVDSSFAARVGVFTSQTPEEIRAIMNTARLDYAQLHGDQDEAFCDAVGARRVLKVLWPERFAAASQLQAEIDRFAPHCRMFLFDAGRGGGGHGRSIASPLLRDVSLDRPWLLAGGLTPANALPSMESVGAWGVDLNSGVESTPGRKDPMKVRRAMLALKPYDS